VTFDVDLHCGGCEDRVTDALDEQDGKHEVDTDADAQRVEVTFNPHQLCADDLRDTIATSAIRSR
jgi:copper chaperone CopZ